VRSAGSIKTCIGTNVEQINKIRKLILTPRRGDEDRNQIKNKLQNIFARYFGLENKSSSGARRKMSGYVR